MATSNNSKGKVRPLIAITIFLAVISCSKKEPLSDSCKDIIESDSFYYALPLSVQQYKQMYRLENYLTAGTDSVQTIDFDCAVIVNPTNEQVGELKKMQGQDFEENAKIDTRHREAARCMIESRGIQTLTATGQFIRFTSKNQTWHLDVQRDMLPDWKLILYKEGNAPLILPGLTLTMEDVDQYFKNVGR
ncbi:hypothetical protein KK083_29350 [Fulvivirgaceae bacterium PWU4]|uniref:Uncharacterized protein n=1 Tax=Chryseosolibacter histidini TaxID=2782349 RepID=A0AAP2GSD9_9BACT|nr:hypothetical protein [Chryseosolibacter histidini]MBT1701035.1 hypothetical protein [Chryseosolibacter histidini]